MGRLKVDWNASILGPDRVGLGYQVDIAYGLDLMEIYSPTDYLSIEGILIGGLVINIVVIIDNIRGFR